MIYVLIIAATLVPLVVWYIVELRFTIDVLRWQLMMQRQRWERHEAGINIARLDEYADG